MDSNSVLIFLSVVVIFSYIFDLLSKRTKMPSVLLLFATGLGLQYLLPYLGFAAIQGESALPVIGTIGLILIVLEGALELRFEKEKLPLIWTTLGSAFFILVVTAISFALLFRYMLHLPFQVCLVNAIPLSIISSAIAIPSVAELNKSTREFVIYETSFSDILGIMFFNFAITNTSFGFGSFLSLGKDVFVTSVIAIALSALLLYLMKQINHHIKFFLILAILVLVYAIAKQFHLSSLIIVLFLGLFLNNAPFIPIRKFQELLVYNHLNRDLHQFLQLTAESAFIIRTFFFIIFGYYMDIQSILNVTVAMNGLVLLAIIYILRGLYIKYIAKYAVSPLTYISPRGLISILLYFSIPDEMRLDENTDGLLLFVILATSLIMTFGLLGNKSKKNEETGTAPPVSTIEA